MRPLNITIVQGAFLPVPPLLGGAVEKAWHALGLEFARQGHRVVHVSRAHPALPATNVEHGVEHRRVRGHATPSSLLWLKFLDLLYSRRVRRVLPAADVLVTNTFWLPLLERRASRGVPYVHVGRYPKGQLRYYPRRVVLQTVSAPIRDAILRELPDAAARIRVLPYPLSPAYLVEQRAPARVILYAGRLHPEKGVHLLIEAFAQRAATSLHGWTLRIIGPWQTAQGGGGESYRAKLAALAAPAGASIDVREPIFDADQLVAHYQQAAIFAYPSLAEFGETFGLAVLEAMAAGCAPVVSSLACFGDFLKSGENGLVFDHRERDPVAALGRALQEVANSQALCDRLRAAAWPTARAYALPEIALRFLRDFHAITERPAEIGSHVTPCLPDQT
ncbi:glycosyltransferase family 4 protein [Opitutus terrae]|nr:glycosyltransferase family 4 protein [Opitutus terrae]